MASYSIGEFSQISRITVKALRLYHEREMLVPKSVDPGSGYRYYDSSQLPLARRIKCLKALGFPLQDIAEILAQCSEDEDLLGWLKERETTLLREIRERKAILRTVRALLDRGRDSAAPPPGAVHEKVLDDQLISGIRMQGRYDEIGGGFRALARAAGRSICGNPFALQYCDEHRDGDAEFEACFPVKREVDGDGVECRILTGGRALTTVHRGAYENLGTAYGTLISHLKERALGRSLPSREIYLKGPGMIFPGNPSKYQTEVQILTD